MSLPKCKDCKGRGKLAVPGSASIRCDRCHGSGEQHLSECAFRAWGKGYRCSCRDAVPDADSG